MVTFGYLGPPDSLSILEPTHKDWPLWQMPSIDLQQDLQNSGDAGFVILKLIDWIENKTIQ